MHHGAPSSGKRPAADASAAAGGAASSSAGAASAAPSAKRPRRASVPSVGASAWIDYCAANKAAVLADGFSGNAVYAELGRRWRDFKKGNGGAASGGPRGAPSTQEQRNPQQGGASGGSGQRVVDLDDL